MGKIFSGSNRIRGQGQASQMMNAMVAMSGSNGKDPALRCSGNANQT